MTMRLFCSDCFPEAETIWRRDGSIVYCSEITIPSSKLVIYVPSFSFLSWNHWLLMPREFRKNDQVAPVLMLFFFCAVELRCNKRTTSSGHYVTYLPYYVVPNYDVPLVHNTLVWYNLNFLAIHAGFVRWPFLLAYKEDDAVFQGCGVFDCLPFPFSFTNYAAWTSVSFVCVANVWGNCFVQCR